MESKKRAGGGRLLGVLLAVALICGAFVGCTTTEKVTVTFYDGETVLTSVSVDKGGTVTAPTLTVENKEFKGWYSVPTFQFKFSFDEKIEENTSVFGKFRPTNGAEDTRSWELVGESPKGGALKDSQWKADKNVEALQLVKKTGAKNEFAVTLDLYAGDLFQVVHSDKFDGQHGFGYVREVDRTVLEGIDNVYEPSQQFKANIKVIKDGNYEVLLYTNMENSDALDEITVTRKGDAFVDKEYITQPVVAGNITGGDVPKAPYGSIELKKEGDLYTTSLYLNKNDYFAVLIDPSWGYSLRTNNVAPKTTDKAAEDALKEIVDLSYLSNIKVKKSGNYKIEMKPAYNSLTLLPDTSKSEVYVTLINETYTPIDGATAVTFKNGSDEDQVAYVRNGTRIPETFIADEEGKTFIGWYKDDGTVLGFEYNLATASDGITVTAKFATAESHDVRDMYLCGYGGSWSPEPVDREGIKANKMTRKAESSEYSLSITAEANTSFNVTSYAGGVKAEHKVGLYFKADSVKTGADLIASTNKGANITVKEKGTYTVTLDTVKREISIVKTA